MWRKAVVVLALMTSAGATELAPLFRGAALGRAHCTDQVCLCRTHCPPKREAASSCHGEREGARKAQLMATCHHGEETAPAPVPPRVLPAMASLLPPWRSGSLSALPVAQVGLGFLRRDLRPPRDFA